MPAKRGRPQTSDGTTAEVANRRAVWRRRQQNRRNRIAAQAGPSQAPPTYAQLQQSEQIIDLTLTEEEAAAITLTQLGLRVQGVALGQDSTGSREQEQAAIVNEHYMLYNNLPVPPPSEQSVQRDATDLTFFRRFTAPRRTGTPEGGRLAQHSISQFFRSLPARRPTPTGTAPQLPQLPQTLQDSNIGASIQGVQYSAGEGSLSPAVRPEQGNIDLGIVASVGQRGGANAYWQADNAFEDVDAIGSSIQEQSPIQAQRGRASATSSASEHLPESEEQGSVEAEPPAVDFVAEKLFQQLMVDFHGCSPQEHEEECRKHVEEAGGNHYGLGEAFNDPTFPSVLGMQEMLSAERLARQQAPSAAQWEAMFCGRNHGGQLPINVCLHKEETEAIEAKVAFDVDSFLGFGSSLALARKGIWCQFVPQMRQNITSDAHVEAAIYCINEGDGLPARTLPAMLRDVPHFFFGRVEGAHDVTIHVLFPHLATARQKFVSLTKNQLTRWMDQVFLPAVYQKYDADYTQHLPGAFDHAYANAKAHQVEGRHIKTASYEAQQAVGYHVQPEHLESIWSDVVDTVNNTPGLADFREPQLFFSAKGTKLQFKTRTSMPTLLSVMDFFDSYFTDVIDPAFVQLDRFYVDIGKEVCPRAHQLPMQTAPVDDQAQVYLYRKCCLEKYVDWMYDGKPPGQGSGRTYYFQNMLRDAASLTSVAPKHSKQREGGLVYSQFYSSVKEIVDATKRYPFTNDALEEMALDPQILRGAHQAAGGQASDARIVERAYLASKSRTRAAINASRQKSFGVREEHRIAWELFLALRDRLRAVQNGGGAVSLPECPLHAWPIQTSVYLGFLWRSVDKFATGFEVVRAQCRKELVTWEQTKMMAMFLRGLRFTVGAQHLPRESALWWSRRERDVGEPPQRRVWLGLGFSNTLPRYGYCWLEPRLDWSRLQFQPAVTDYVLFGNRVLGSQYLRRGRQVREFLDTTRRLDAALSWLDQHRDVDAVRGRLILWIVHICLQQFRVDVLQCVKAEIHEPEREAALQGTEPLCFDWLEEVMVDGVYCMSGNRCDFKVVSHLGHFLFDFDDGRERKHWADRPYRALYRRATAAVALRGREIQVAFRRYFWEALYRHHWILPYPCSNALMQTTKQGLRMWYSIGVRGGLDAQAAEEGDWGWLQKGWQEGRPKAVPEWVWWEREKWEGWLRERAP